MTWLITAGGAPMVVIVLFGLVALLVAARFAWRPDRAQLPWLGGLSAAVFFSIPAGVAADLATVCTQVPANPELAGSDQLPLIVMVGFGESMAPAILGFGVLSLVALVASVGLRRMASA